MAEPGARRFDGERIEGDGFLLRAWRQDDLASLLRHADDPRVPRGLSDRFPHPYTPADGQAFLAGRVVDLTHPVFAIEIAGEACGSVAARPHAGEKAHGAELGYWLGSVHWGHGHMTRVVAAYLAWVVPTLALQRVEASVLDINPASARVLEKNGFVEEGRRRGAIRKPDGLHDLRLFGRIWPA